MQTAPSSAPSFEAVAGALSIAASKLKLELDQLELVAARINLSPMGTALSTSEIKKNIELIAFAHEFFKGKTEPKPKRWMFFFR